MGYSYVELDKAAEAQTALSSYFQKVPADKIFPSDYVYFAKALVKTGSDSLAIVNMRKAMELDKSNTDFVKDIFTIYFKQKNYQKVTVEFEQQTAAGYKPDVNSYFLVARSYYQQKDFIKSDSMNKMITILAPISPSGWIGRAQSNVQLDPESTQGLAKPYFEKYLELVKVEDPKNKNNIIQAYSYLGYYSFLQKDNTATKSWFEKVLAIDPENQQAKDVLAGLK
jgi:tetratricopeptide (TPR) repeat protein